MKFSGILSTAALAALTATSAFGVTVGSLVFDDQFSNQGAGFGTVVAVTTAHQTSGTGLEESCVGWNGSADIYSCIAGSGITGGDHSTTGAPQNATRTMLFLLDELGIDSISEIGLVVNPSQTGANPSITLLDLYIGIFDTDGTILYRFDYGGPLVLDADNLGIGGEGFGFRLSDADQALYNNIFANGYRVGAGVSFENCDEGPDTVNLARYASEDGPPEVPEPSSMLLMGGGLLGLAYWRKRKNS